MTQPKDLPIWAYNTNFPAGSDPWSGTAIKVAPADPELAAGAVPGGQLPAQTYNYLLNNAQRHITALADVYALNWRSYAGDASVFSTPSTTLTQQHLVSAQDAATGTLWLVVKSVSGVLVRSRDYFRTVETCTNLAVTINGLSGEVNRNDLTSDNGLIIMSNESKLYLSSDVGFTWSAGTDLSAVCTVVARSHPLGLVIVAGFNVIKTLDSALGSLTSRTVPASWSALTPAGIAVPRAGEGVGKGAIIWPASAVTNVLHSPDGVTWTNVSVASGQVVGGCWSEAHGKWFVITTAGRVYASTDPTSVGWTLQAVLYPSSGAHFYAIKSFGRNLVICGSSISDGAKPCGSVLVTSDFSTYTVLTTGEGEPGSSYGNIPTNAIETCLVHHDGQLVAAHTHTYSGPTYVPHCSVSMRAPWL